MAGTSHRRGMRPGSVRDFEPLRLGRIVIRSRCKRDALLLPTPPQRTRNGPAILTARSGIRATATRFLSSSRRRGEKDTPAAKSERGNAPGREGAQQAERVVDVWQVRDEAMSS